LAYTAHGYQMQLEESPSILLSARHVGESEKTICELHKSTNICI